MRACVCFCISVYTCVFIFEYVVNRIMRSSRVIKMVVLARIQYNDKEVKNSTIGCMLFLYH